MSGRKIGGALVVVFIALLAAALVDGGEEPLRPIEQAVELPEAGQ